MANILLRPIGTNASNTSGTDVAWSGASGFYGFSSNSKSLYANSGNIRSRFPASSAAISRYADSSNIRFRFYPSSLGKSLMNFSANKSLYPASSLVNRNLINTISSNIDTRIDSLFNWSSNKSLYAPSTLADSRYDQYVGHSGNTSKHVSVSFSSNSKWAYTWLNASGSQFANLLASGNEYTSARKSGQALKVHSFHAIISSQYIKGYIASSTAISRFADSSNIRFRFKSSSNVWIFASSQRLSGQLLNLHNSRDINNWDSHNWKNSGLIWNETLGKWNAKPSGGGVSNLSQLTIDVSKDWNTKGIYNLGYISSTGIIKGSSIIGIISSTTIGLPSDGSLSDGCLSWTASTKTTDALDEVNELLSELAPADATSLAGKALVCNRTAHSGRLASGALTNWTYEAGYGPSSSVTYIFDDTTYLFNANGVSTGITFNKADEGNLKTLINSVSVATSGISLSSKFNETYRGTKQIYTPLWSGCTRILAVGKYNNFRKWQVGSGQINITGATALRKGYNYIYLYRDGLTTNVSSAAYKIWYDPTADTSPALIAAPKIVQSTKTSKYLSGIEHYYLNSIFNVTCSSQECFKDAWRTDRTIFQLGSFTAAATATITPDNAYCAKVGTGRTNINRYPCTGDTIGVYNYPMTLTTASSRSITSTVTATCYNAYGNNGGQASVAEGRLIDTYASGVTGTSDDWNEYFDDEWYRLPSGTYLTIPTQISGSWRSQTVLGKASAQVYNGTLITPTLNFSTGYLPTGGPNYSTATLPVVLFRAFRHNGTPHTNGKIELEGLTSSDVVAKGSAGNVNVELKLPSQTGWLDLGKAYSAGTFTGITGDGCQTAQSGDSWSYTSGTFTTTNSGYMIIVKVTFLVNSEIITRMREEGWQGL